jgi:uncharacterized NAD(P)/FAD-binding protein YdhS
VSSRTILIVGGGFSGTVLAANLLRHPPAAATRIILVERRAVIGCGVAYAPRSFPYLLNVPASRMSAVSDRPSDLVEFARSRQLPADGDTYLPRQFYGEYLQHVLQEAELAAPRHVRLERVHGEATAIHPFASGRVIVQVGDERWQADQVVLACGNPSSLDKSCAAEITGHKAYRRDPHGDDCTCASDRQVLLIGTGLTMVDVALAAVARNPAVHLTAISRHGLLPATQESARAPVLDQSLDLSAQFAGLSTRRLVSELRVLAQAVQSRGGDWREVIMRMRDAVPALWGKLRDIERQRFLRHVRAYWDVHRHRMPPANAAQIAALRHSGQLQLHAGRIQRLWSDGDQLIARWRPRGRPEAHDLRFDRIVDCSGFDQRLAHTTDPLLRRLLDDGWASCDPAGLGLRTGTHGALIDTDGRTSGQLHYLGPMLRADHWEATAVGELRVRAEQLAAALSTPEVLQPAAGARSRSAFAITETELKAMAALANMGLRTMPKAG